MKKTLFTISLFTAINSSCVTELIHTANSQEYRLHISNPFGIDMGTIRVEPTDSAVIKKELATALASNNENFFSTTVDINTVLSAIRKNTNIPRVTLEPVFDKMIFILSEESNELIRFRLDAGKISTI